MHALMMMQAAVLRGDTDRFAEGQQTQVVQHSCGRSKQFRAEAVCACRLTCQLPRLLDLVMEQLVEVGDEILGGALAQ